jgi:hypothetical protein
MMRGKKSVHNDAKKRGGYYDVRKKSVHNYAGSKKAYLVSPGKKADIMTLGRKSYLMLCLVLLMDYIYAKRASGTPCFA